VRKVRAGLDSAPSVEDDDLRLDPEQWSAFWGAFIHVVRNAVDHGIECIEEREDSGKATRGRISISTRLDGPDFVIELADDGRGIDWERLAEVASAKGLRARRRRT
jgi:two-component system chemotaxis sensor kinase CheA